MNLEPAETVRSIIFNFYKKDMYVVYRSPPSGNSKSALTFEKHLSNITSDIPAERNTDNCRNQSMNLRTLDRNRKRLKMAHIFHTRGKETASSDPASIIERRMLTVKHQITHRLNIIIFDACMFNVSQ